MEERGQVTAGYYSEEVDYAGLSGGRRNKWVDVIRLAGLVQ